MLLVLVVKVVKGDLGESNSTDSNDEGKTVLSELHQTGDGVAKHSLPNLLTVRSNALGDKTGGVAILGPPKLDMRIGGRTLRREVIERHPILT